MQHDRTSVPVMELARRHWLILVVGLLLAYVDPFGVSSKTSQAVSDGFDRLHSSFYSASLIDGHASETGDLVDVILIDDPSIVALSNPEVGYLQSNDWPLTYSDYGIVIDALRRKGYGTIVMDITFYRTRQRDDGFDGLVRRLAFARDNLGLAVVLGGGQDPGKLEASVQPLKEAVSGVGRTAWSGYGSLYPVDFDARAEEDDATLAVAGLKAFCSQAGVDTCSDLTAETGHWFVPQPSGMHLSWGLPATRMAASFDCEGPPPNAGRNKRIFRAVFGIDDIDGEARPICPPLPTARLSDVFCSGEDCDFFSKVKEAPGRIAVVGVSLPSARDLFNPPIAGQLPGVYLHAEALRNLLHYQANYLKPIGWEWDPASIGLPFWKVPVDIVLAWPALLLVVLSLTRRCPWIPWGRDYRSRCSEIVLEIFELTVVVLGLCLIYALALLVHRTPGFLAELIGLTPLLFIAIRRERKEMKDETQTYCLPDSAVQRPAIGRTPVH